MNRSRNPVPGTALVGLVAWLATLIGCAGASRNPELTPPEGLSVGIRYHSGGIVSGPQARVGDPATFEPQQALALRFQVVLVERMPVEGVEPLESLARFVASVEAGEPIVSNAPFLRTAGLTVGQAATTLHTDLSAGKYGRTLVLDDLRGALPYGVTAVLAGRAVEPHAADGRGGARRLAENMLGLHVARAPSGTAIELGLGLRDVTGATGSPAADGGEDADRPGELRTELVLLRDLPFDGVASAGLVFPSPFQESPGRGFVVFLELHGPPAESGDAEAWSVHAVAAEEVHEEVVASAAQVAEEAHFGGVDVALLALMDAVLGAQRPGNVDEPALFGLASSLGAWLACDLILVSDAAVLDELVADVNETRARDSSTLDTRADFAWLLDRGTWRVVAHHLLEGEGELVIDSIALRHAGELGRYPATILEGLDDASTHDEFKRFVIQENLGFLSDSHPAARLRAFDWLRLQAEVPAGYDPLAEPEARRAALDAFYDSLRKRVRELPTEASGS